MAGTAGAFFTFKVGHVGPHLRVQRVDDHLPVRRPRDLDPAVDQARGGVRALPGDIIADVLSLGEEVREDTAVDLGLADDAALEKGLASRVEGALEEGEEGEGLRGEDLALVVLDLAEDIDALEDGIGGGHDGGGSGGCPFFQESCRVQDETVGSNGADQCKLYRDGSLGFGRKQIGFLNWPGDVWKEEGRKGEDDVTMTPREKKNGINAEVERLRPGAQAVTRYSKK